MSMFRKQKGFTLIELLIVVIILGILMVIAIPKFMSNRIQSEYNSCRTNIRMVNDAAERWMYDTGATTFTAANIANLSDGSVTIGARTNIRYLDNTPNCPSRDASGAHYTYTYASGTTACQSVASVVKSDHNDPDQSFQ